MKWKEVVVVDSLLILVSIFLVASFEGGGREEGRPLYRLR